MNNYKIIDNILLSSSPPMKLAELALQSGLFIKGKEWMLRGQLKRILSQGLGQGEAILLATLSEVHLGVATLSDGHIEVYVKKAYRGYGIGSLLVNTSRQKHTNEFVWGSEGGKGTLKFWQKLRVGTH